jgi:hypothetical protein
MWGKGLGSPVQLLINCKLGRSKPRKTFFSLFQQQILKLVDILTVVNIHFRLIQISLGNCLSSQCQERSEGKKMLQAMRLLATESDVFN